MITFTDKTILVDCKGATYCQPVNGFIKYFFIRFDNYENAKELSQKLADWKENFGLANYKNEEPIIKFFGSKLELNGDYVGSFTIMANRKQVKIQLPVQQGTWFLGMTDEQWNQVQDDFEFNLINNQ